MSRSIPFGKWHNDDEFTRYVFTALETIGKREAGKVENLRDERIRELLGIKENDGTQLSHIKAGRMKVTSKMLHSLVKDANISARFLLTGENPVDADQASLAWLESRTSALCNAIAEEGMRSTMGVINLNAWVFNIVRRAFDYYSAMRLHTNSKPLQDALDQLVRELCSTALGKAIIEMHRKDPNIALTPFEQAGGPQVLQQPIASIKEHPAKVARKKLKAKPRKESGRS